MALALAGERTSGVDELPLGTMWIGPRKRRRRRSYWRVDGETAAREGLVTRAVDDAEVEAVAAAMAGQLAGPPPGAVADTKRLLREPLAAALKEAMDRERAAFSERLRSPEAKAIFAAFLNRKG